MCRCQRWPRPDTARRDRHRLRARAGRCARRRDARRNGVPSRKRLGQTSATPLSSEPLPMELPGDSAQCSSTEPAPTTVASAPTPHSALEIAAESAGSVRGVGCSSKWHRRTAAPPPAGRDQLPPSRVSIAAPSAARVTIGEERRGTQPEVTQRCRRARVDVLTVRRGRQPQWPERPQRGQKQRPRRRRTRRLGGRQREYAFSSPALPRQPRMSTWRSSASGGAPESMPR